MQRRDFLLGGAAVAWPFAALMLLYCGQADAASERTEYWPPIWGYSLKVTDTLLATFTFSSVSGDVCALVLDKKTC
jgi:hypothetical protein